jgi:beta-glucosidase
MLRVIAICILLLSTAATTAAAATTPAPRQTMKEFINNLMAQMTDEEKAGQLAQYSTGATTGPGGTPLFKEDIAAGRAGSILNAVGAKYTRELQELAVNKTRLKIPLLFGYDVIHGYKTIFPIPLAEAASWDLDLMQKSARIAAREAAADGVHWTFAPMVDVSRDPRWGRIMEGAGEDPWLGGLIAEARVRGFQGKKLGSTSRVMACVKHFAAYGAPIGGRDYNTVDMSERTLAEVYMPPYQSAVNAGAATVMTSFNEVNGVPSTSNHWLLTTILRDYWGFKGFVVTDWTSIKELVAHGVAENVKRATELSINAGVDMDMVTGGFNDFLPQLIQEGKVSRQAMDSAVRRILEAKYRLGLFQDPYRFNDEERAKKVMMAPSHLKHAREIAKRAIVLLKNDNGVLPLKREGKVALLGPMVKNQADMLGGWAAQGEPGPVVTLERGLQEVMGTGVTFIHPIDSTIMAAVTAARRADKVVIALGESRNWSGEASSVTEIRLPQDQLALLEAVHAVGKPLILIVNSGRPLALEKEVLLSDAIVQAWFLGTASGYALADVLSGDYNPSGKLPVTFPRNEGQIPIFYAHKNTGRPFKPEDDYTSRYLDRPNSPLFPFGWGLSYTTFEYSDVRLSAVQLEPNQALKVEVTLKNTGARAGEEVVQLYVRDLVGSVTRPVKQLRGFRKLMLQPGESRVVAMELRLDDLKFYDLAMNWTAEPGRFHVLVGGNSAEVKWAEFELMPAAIRLPAVN